MHSEKHSDIMTPHKDEVSSTVPVIYTQLYSPFEKAAQLYAKNESEHLTNQQH